MTRRLVRTPSSAAAVIVKIEIRVSETKRSALVSTASSATLQTRLQMR